MSFSASSNPLYKYWKSVKKYFINTGDNRWVNNYLFGLGQQLMSVMTKGPGIGIIL